MESIVKRLESDLSRTRSQLRATIEQHEVSIEELKAANEELQAINEELRSAGEELETSKEELQSVNEELITVNHELKEKMDETSRINSDLQNLMAATDIATIFLDKNLRIKRYTPPVEDFFNITKADIGRPLEHFTHKLNYDDLPKDAARVLKNLAPIEKEIGDRNNRHYLARFVPYRTIDDRIEGIVLNFIDITARRRAEENLRFSEERLQKAINIETVGVIFFNNEFEITECNEAFAQMSGYTREELKKGRFNWQKFTPDVFFEVSSRAIVELNPVGISTPYEKEYVRKDGTRFWALFAAKRIGKNEIVEFVTDITDQKRTEEALRASEEKYRTLFDSMDEGVSTLEVIFDEDERSVDFLYLENNQALTRLTGLPDDINGRLVSEVTPDLEAFWLEMYARVARTGTPERAEHFITAINRWFDVFAARVGGADSRRLVVLYNNITERKQREQQQEYLLKLADAMRSQSDPVKVIETVSQTAIDYFAADRCYFGVIENDAIIIERDAVRGDLTSVAATYPLNDFALFKKAVEAGRPLVVQDSSRAEILDAELKRLCLDLQVISFIKVPVIKGGRAVGVFCLEQSAPRDWTASEVELAVVTAEQTWTAVERARAEELLRESEEQFRRAIEDAPIPVIMHAEDGEVLQVSRSWTELTGYTLEDKDIIQNWLTRAYGFGGDKLRDAMEQEFSPEAGKPMRAVVFEIITRQGEHRTWSFSASTPGRLRDGRRFIVGMAEDITDRKRSEVILRETEAHLRIAVEAAELGTWDWNVERDEVFWNERHFTILGMKPRKQPLKSKAFFDRVHPEDREWVAARLWKCVEENCTFEAEFRVVCEDTGTTRWMEGYGRVVEERGGRAARMSGVMSDITHRKLSEEAVTESSERLRLLVESTSDYAIFTTTLDGTIDSWNAGAEKIFGWTEKEAVGLPTEIIFTPEDRAKGEHLKEMKTALRQGRAPDERFHLKKDGTRFYVSGVMNLLRDAAGNARGFVKIARDMTERIAAETALREKETLQKLVTAQEDERKRIARDLHDELGQQLTALRIKLDAISKNQKEPVLLNQLNDIQNIARQIDDGVDFLAFELRPTTLDDLGLTAALDKYVRQWSHYSGVKAQLTVSNLKRARFAPEIETCLYRIVQEALNNTHKHAEAADADVILEKRGDTLILIIEDNGKGFNQKSKTTRSKGLGLIGMKERAALVGGTLEIETAPKQGTTIYVRIPFFAAREKSNDGK